MSDERPQHDNPATASAPQSPDTEIVAGPGARYRITHYILVLILLGAGAYCAWDGFWVYPAEKAKYDRAGQPYPTLNIPFNRTLGILLPPAALALLAWTLYNSRGAYRLAGTTLHIPGHPPIPLDCICKIDKRKWDKKGIAFIEYELPGDDQVGRLRFDDYVYDQDPADKIFDRIEKHIQAMA